MNLFIFLTYLKCALCLQVCLIVFCDVFIAHHRPVMFKRVPQVSGAFSTLELDCGQWRKENETSARGDDQCVLSPCRVI